MHRKEIMAFISNQDVIGKLEEIGTAIDADIAYFDIAKIDSHNFTDLSGCDLLLFEIGDSPISIIEPIEAATQENEGISTFYIVGESNLSHIATRFGATSDFASENASVVETMIRIKKLLWPTDDEDAQEVLKVGRMEVNLSTYQVSIDDSPLDLTYLEYKLLVFLVEHPGKTYSREALLKHVWGFDYYGGSRTVDVHIRRLRAKLGPDCARDLMTVRGVGYYWRSE